jgi:hypothetical protein
MMATAKEAVVNLTGIAGALVAAAGGAAQTLPIPPEIAAMAPGTETSVHGLMALVLVALFKNMPRKEDAASQEEKFKGIHDKLDGMMASRTEERVELAGWTGGVTKTLEHHGELIHGLSERVDRLRYKAS